jgi:hypothetical protein
MVTNNIQHSHCDYNLDEAVNFFFQADLSSHRIPRFIPDFYLVFAPNTYLP